MNANELSLITSKSLDEVTKDEYQLFDVHQVLGFKPIFVFVQILGQLRMNTAQLQQTESSMYTTQ